MTICQIEAINAGGSYPRSCPTCGLAGVCVKGLPHPFKKAPQSADQARTQFDYLLNAFEQASQSDKPAEHGYGEKRRALFAYVRELEARAAELAAPAQGVEALAAQIEALPMPGRDRIWRPRDAFDAGFRAGIEDSAKLVRSSSVPAAPVQPADTLLESHLNFTQQVLGHQAGPSGSTRAAEAGSSSAWVSVEDRVPGPDVGIVLAAFEMDSPGDWRMKCASYEPECPDLNIRQQGGWRIFGGGWRPSHWMPLPAPPQGALTEPGASS
jgi:hypothetical protein